jgi:hypothetical protein
MEASITHQDHHGGLHHPSRAQSTAHHPSPDHHDCLVGGLLNGLGFNSRYANSLRQNAASLHNTPVTPKPTTTPGAGFSNSFTYNIDLISATLDTPKYSPLVFSNLGLDVLLYLESSANVGVWGEENGDNTVAAATQGYHISDCKWHCHMVDVDRSFYDQLRAPMMQMKQIGPIVG